MKNFISDKNNKTTYLKPITQFFKFKNLIIMSRFKFQYERNILVKDFQNQKIYFTQKGKTYIVNCDIISQSDKEKYMFDNGLFNEMNNTDRNEAFIKSITLQEVYEEEPEGYYEHFFDFLHDYGKYTNIVCEVK